MSWASTRSTSKEEDLTYCLLGIFDVNMPLLYGERLTTAFRRLQLTILEMQDDTSIFAWRSPEDKSLHQSANTYGLLAQFPAYFKSSKNVISMPFPVVEGYREGIRVPIVSNNKGLHPPLPVLTGEGSNLKGILGCSEKGSENSRCAIWLSDVSTNGGRYVRVNDLDTQIFDSDLGKEAQFETLSTELRLFKNRNTVHIDVWVNMRSA